MWYLLQPKYVEKLLKAARTRELEYCAREERKQQRERAQEGEEFAEKDVFVTGAYRRQMEELEQFRKQQEYQDRLDDLMDVQKQGGLSGFYRTLLDDLTADQRNAPKTNQAAAAAATDDDAVEPPKPSKPYTKPETFEDENLSDDEKPAIATTKAGNGASFRRAGGETAKARRRARQRSASASSNSEDDKRHAERYRASVMSVTPNNYCC